MTGVSFASIRRFETTGQISFESLVKIAISIDMKGDVKTSSTNGKSTGPYRM